MLVISKKYNLEIHVILMVACLTVNEVFTDSEFKPSRKPKIKEDEDKKMSEDEDLKTAIDVEREQKQKLANERREKKQQKEEYRDYL
jgi:hypothetical protein